MAYPKHDERVKAQALEFYAKFGPNEAARRMKGIVAKGRIIKWAKAAGLKPPDRASRLSPELSRGPSYNKVRRLKLNDKFFYRIEATLKKKGSSISPADLKNLILAYAILLDKRRLEEDASVGNDSSLSPEQVFEEGELRTIRMRGQSGSSKSKRRALVSDIEEERSSRRASNE